MAFVSNPNQDEDNVASSTPLSQEAPAADPSTQGDSAAQSGNMPGQTQTSTPKAPSTTNKSGKASSGMFTNIQKYVQKNKPQAQKMAQAATQDFSKQAQDIGQQAAAKQAQQTQSIAANTQAIDAGKSFADQQVANIMTPQEGGFQAPTAENQARFQSLMGGNIEGYNQLQNVDLSQQATRAGALADLAGRSTTEEGRRNLLQETFKDRAPYGRGASRLDQLIVSGDPAAREAMISGTQQQSEALQGQLDTAGKSGSEALAAQQLVKQQMQQQINESVQNPLSELETAQSGLSGRLGALDVGSSVTDADLASLGVTREQVANLYGVDPSSFIDSRGVTADQKNKLNALYSLTGSGGQGFSDSDVYNPQGFLDEIQGAKGRYETAYGDTASADKISSDYLTNLSSKGIQIGDTSNLIAETNKGLAHAYETGTAPSAWQQQFYPQYKAARDAQRAGAQSKYKFGQGLK